MRKAPGQCVCGHGVSIHPQDSGDLSRRRVESLKASKEWMKSGEERGQELSGSRFSLSLRRPGRGLLVR
jgi:hypothetical protein